MKILDVLDVAAVFVIAVTALIGERSDFSS
jgi:hypothetical protein